MKSGIIPPDPPLAKGGRRDLEIVYIAVNRWDSMIQREQHLMMGLSRTYRILYIEPPLSIVTLLFGKARGDKRPFKGCLHCINDRLIVYTPPAFPPFSQHLHWIHLLHANLLNLLVKRLLQRFSFHHYILGIGNPFLGDAVKAFTPQFSYYDCSDDYLRSPRLRGDKEMLKRLEEELVRSVDLIFCTSRALVEAKAVLNQNCFFVPNGVDLTSFSNQPVDAEIPRDIRAIQKPILGYMGLIDERIDVESLMGLAKTRPDWSIVLIGPLKFGPRSSAFTGFHNIHLLGEKKYDELPDYLNLFDVCLIPFHVDDFTRKIYPTKFHQYLGAGKPVVSSYLPDLEPFQPWVTFYHDAKEMEKAIDRAIEEDSEEKALARRRIAGENTWDQRVKSIVEIFNRVYSENRFL